MQREIGVMLKIMLKQWKMLQQKKPIDLVISTGKQTTVKNFVSEVSKKLNMKIFLEGQGSNEKC